MPSALASVRPDRRQVFFPTDVNPDVQLSALRQIRKIRRIRNPVRRALVFARRDHLVTQKRARIVRWHAHVLLQKTLLVRTAALDKVEVVPLVHLLTLVVRRELRLQAVQKTVLQRVFQRHTVQRYLLRIPFFAHFGDELVEKIVASAVCRHHLQLTAPGDARIGDRIELARVLVQRELVQQTVPALARLRIRRTRHRVDFHAARKLEHVGLRIADQIDPEVPARSVQSPRKMLAVLQKQPRLNLVPARHPRIIARSRKSFAPDKRIRARP